MASYRVIGGDHQEYGPATVEEIVAWINEGRLSGQSLGKVEGESQWRPLSAFPEFAAALREQASHFLAINPPLQGANMRMRDNVVSTSRCLARSWDLLKSNFGLLAGASGLVWLLGIVCQFLPVIGGFLYLVLDGVLYGGLCLVFLRRIRGQSVSAGDVFSGFGPLFPQLALAGIVTSVLTWIGVFFCFVPYVYLTVAWVFAIPLVADKRLEFWPAMEASRRRVNSVFLQMLLLMVAAFLPSLLMFLYTQGRIFAVAYPGFQELMRPGQADMNQWLEFFGTVARTSMPLVMLNKVVLLLNLPFAVGALMFAYEDLFGEGPRS